MHMHTRESSPCGEVPAKEQVRACADLGYTGVFITDHFTRSVMQPYGDSWRAQVDGFLAGWRAAREAGERLGLKVFLGAELRFDEFGEDFLLYGADEAFFYRQQWLYALTLAQFSAISRRQGYFLAQAHPFREWNQPRGAQYLDGAELYNGHPGHSHNVPAAAAWLWDKGLIPLSGSDSHHPHSQGRGGICVPPGCDTPQQVIERLRQNRYALIVPPGDRGIGPYAG